MEIRLRCFNTECVNSRVCPVFVLSLRFVFSWPLTLTVCKLSATCVRVCVYVCVCVLESNAPDVILQERGDQPLMAGSRERIVRTLMWSHITISETPAVRESLI